MSDTGIYGIDPSIAMMLGRPELAGWMRETGTQGAADAMIPTLMMTPLGIPQTIYYGIEDAKKGQWLPEFGLSDYAKTTPISEWDLQHPIFDKAELGVLGDAAMLAPYVGAYGRDIMSGARGVGRALSDASASAKLGKAARNIKGATPVEAEAMHGWGQLGGDMKPGVESWGMREPTMRYPDNTIVLDDRALPRMDSRLPKEVLSHPMTAPSKMWPTEFKPSAIRSAYDRMIASGRTNPSHWEVIDDMRSRVSAERKAEIASQKRAETGNKYGYSDTATYKRNPGFGEPGYEEPMPQGHSSRTDAHAQYVPPMRKNPNTGVWQSTETRPNLWFE